MSTTTGILTRSDGSAKFQFGKSCVLTSIYGPMNVKMRDELLDKSFINVIFTPVSGSGGTHERLYEGILRQTASSIILATLFPRTMIKITCQVLADDGSILSTAMNSMILALLDAGVPLTSTFSAVTCMIHKDGNLLLDPTNLELEVVSTN